MSRRGGKRKQSRSKRLAQAQAQRAQEQANAKHASRGERGVAAPTPRQARATSSTVVSLDPLAPIIVRSARPMVGRSDADPARFPPPSTTAGCLRTAWARATGRPFGPELAELTVAGPLLLTRTDQVLAPKPADALYFGHGDKARCRRAEPRPFDAGAGADPPGGLLPVQLTAPDDGKPGPGPAWWGWDDLLAFRRGEPVSYRKLSENGWTPEGDRRTHVAINPGTGAADPGRLFQTEGLDLDAPSKRLAIYLRDGLLSPTEDLDLGPPEQPAGPSAGGLRLLIRCGEALGETLVHLGGKRRLAALQPEDERIWPTPPPGWLNGIGDAGGLCLTLLTPGIFSTGYRPGWLDDETLTGSPPVASRLRLQLRAAAVGRWQPHSGWDLARRQPRATRRLAGAGATYWFRILGEARPDLLEALWLASISDLEQDRRDGFGLVLPSPWTPLA